MVVIVNGVPDEKGIIAEEPATPVGPVAPTPGPVAPVAPVEPVGPVAPRNPRGPRGPWQQLLQSQLQGEASSP